MAKKLPYEEGSVFTVPLRPNGFAIGVVARMAPKGKVILAYFFDRCFLSVPDFESVKDLEPFEAIKVVEVGDLGLYNGEWKVIGKVPSWNRIDWPMPQFIRKDPLRPLAWLVTYSDDNPIIMLSEEKVPFDTEGYENAGLWGYGAVEKMLSRKLNCE